MFSGPFWLRNRNGAIQIKIPALPVAPTAYLAEQTKEAKAERNLVARIEMSSLAVPFVPEPTTKELILELMRREGGNFSVTYVAERFPEIAPKGISSRMSELHKEGRILFVDRYKRKGVGPYVNFYRVPGGK